jgi:hypothetical protein
LLGEYKVVVEDDRAATIHLGPTKKSAPSAHNALKFCEIAFSHLNLDQLSFLHGSVLL